MTAMPVKIGFKCIPVSYVDLNSAAHLARPFLKCGLKICGPKPDSGKLERIQRLRILPAADKRRSNQLKWPRGPPSLPKGSVPSTRTIPG